MYFPKYWAKANYRGVTPTGLDLDQEFWGWSDISVADARTKAAERARQLVATWSGDPRAREHYGYPNRPLREPVLVTIAHAEAVAAVVTRNRVGCEVLNTDRVMFLDVDLPTPPRPSLFARLFGGGTPTADPLAQPTADKIAGLELWSRNRRDLTFRVYRTAAGLRYLLTSALVSPEDEMAHDAFEQLDVDPQYRQLCVQQKSFRARLTPKPYRCKVGRAPFAFPGTDPAVETRFAAWISKYDTQRQGYAVCRLVRTIGSAPMRPAVKTIVDEHDRRTGVGSVHPLA